MNAIKSISSIYKKFCITELHGFTVRFSQQLIKSVYDKSDAIAIEAINLSCFLIKYGELKQKNIDALFK